MRKVVLNEIDIFKFEQFSEFKSIKHFVTSRRFSKGESFSLSLSSIKDIDPIIKNRKVLSEVLRIPTESFVFQQQEHTNNISIVTENDKGKSFNSYANSLINNDGMITCEKDICLMVMGADCVPILFYDPVKEVVGAAHAGWRGTVKGIAMETVRMMREKFSCKPEEIKVGIGPSIGPENYEVDMPVYNAFSEAFSYSPKLFKPNKINGRFMLDLWKANQLQLLSVGIKDENIEIANICTFENNELFFSARKGDSGRFAAGIMMLDN